MNERVKKVRKANSLSQFEFGEKLGVVNTAISKIEKGQNNVSEQMIILICREFNVNEQWLRTGEGEMFNETDDSTIGEVAKAYNLDSEDCEVLAAYAELDAETRKAIKGFMREVVDKFNSKLKSNAPSPDERPVKKEQATKKELPPLTEDEYVELARQRFRREHGGKKGYTTTSENTDDTDSIIA